MRSRISTLTDKLYVIESVSKFRTRVGRNKSSPYFTADSIKAAFLLQFLFSSFVRFVFDVVLFRYCNVYRCHFLYMQTVMGSLIRVFTVCTLMCILSGASRGLCFMIVAFPS